MCLGFLDCLLQHSSLCPIDLVVSASFHRRIASLLSPNVNCYALWYLGRYLLPRLAFWVCIYGGGVEIASYVVSRNKVELNTEKHSNVSIFGRFPQDWCMPSCQHLFVALDCTSATLQTHFLPLFLSPSSPLSLTQIIYLFRYFLNPLNFSSSCACLSSSPSKGIGERMRGKIGISVCVRGRSFLHHFPPININYIEDVLIDEFGGEYSFNWELLSIFESVYYIIISPPLFIFSFKL